MSRILHDVPSNINADGLDVTRITKLAEFIRTLRLIRKEYPYSEYKYVDKYNVNPDSYVLHTKNHGLGIFRFEEGEGKKLEFAALTGYGLMCWGWGYDKGMANVCTNKHINQIQRVLTATPILGFDEERIISERIELDTNLIAEALLEYIESKDAATAWRIVVDRYHAGQITPFEPATEKSENIKHQPENPVIDQTNVERLRQQSQEGRRKTITVETRRPKPRVSAKEKVGTILNWIESADSIEDVQTYVKLLRKELEKD